MNDERRPFCFPLQNLPIDALSGILDLLDARYWADLWACGASKLNNKLQSPGCALNCHIQVSLLERTVWPLSIRRFPQIQHLSMKSCTRYHPLRSTDAEWSFLPRNLRSLILETSKCFIGLQSALAANPCLFTSLEELCILDNAHTNDLQVGWKWPAALLSLRLLSESHTHCLDLDLLPPNLTVLEVHVREVVATFNPSLPPNLTKLHLSYAGFDLSIPWWKTLPSTLEDFKWKAELVDQGNLRVALLSTELVKQCPKLIRLSLPPLSASDLLTLVPPRVTFLENNWPEGNRNSYWDSASSRLWIEKRPNLLLRELNGFFQRGVDHPIAKYLPRSLTLMDQGVALSALPYLPRGMKELEIVFDDVSPDSEDSDQEWDELPDDDEAPLPPKWHIQGFPEMLQTLGVYCEILPKRWLPSIASLPLLTSIIVSNALSVSDIKMLPPTLTKLTVRKGNLFANPEESIPALPRSLTSVSSDEMISEWSQCDPIEPYLAQQLPPKLQRLKYSYSDLSLDFIAQIPSTLSRIYLVLLNERILFPTDVRACSFPETLTHIEIFFSLYTREFSFSKLFKTLPKGLKRFSLQFLRKKLDAVITLDDLKHLPRNLTSLTLPVLNSGTYPPGASQVLPKMLKGLYVGEKYQTWPHRFERKENAS